MYEGLNVEMVFLAWKKSEILEAEDSAGSCCFEAGGDHLRRDVVVFEVLQKPLD